MFRDSCQEETVTAKTSTGSIASAVNDMSDCGLQYSDVIAIFVGGLEFCGGMWLIGLTFLGLVWIRRLRRHTKKKDGCGAGVRAGVELVELRERGGIDERPPTRPKKIRNEQNVRQRRASSNLRSYRWWDQDGGGMIIGWNLLCLWFIYFIYFTLNSFVKTFT